MDFVILSAVAFVFWFLVTQYPVVIIPAVIIGMLVYGYKYGRPNRDVTDAKTGV